jgi:hypothetical protein
VLIRNTANNALRNTAPTAKIPVNVWYPFNSDNHKKAKIWTADEILYAEICCRDYVQLTSLNARL